MITTAHVVPEPSTKVGEPGGVMLFVFQWLDEEDDEDGEERTPVRHVLARRHRPRWRR